MARGPGVTPLVDLGGRSAWSVLPPLVLGFFMIMVDTTIVNIAIPTLAREFDATVVQIGWVNSAYLLPFATLMLVTGRLGDRFGPRPVFLTGLVVFTVASFGCGFSGELGTEPHIGWLIAFRVLQGVGAAMMTPQTMAMITRVFPPQRRGGALGLWGATAGVATVAGPLLGGVLVGTLGWEWIFYVNIPLGLVAVWLALRSLPRLPSRDSRVDLLGIPLSVVGLGALVFGVQEGPTFAWGQIVGPVTVPSVIAAGMIVIGAFLWWQRRRGEAALIPLRLFRVRNFSLATGAGAAVSFAMLAFFFPMTLFVQTTLGLSAIQTALILAPNSLVSGVVAPFAGRLSDRVPGKWVSATGFTALVVSIAWIIAVLDEAMSPLALLAPLVLFGAGTGLTYSPLSNIAAAGLDHRSSGAGAGAFNTVRQVGTTMGSAAIVALLSSRMVVVDAATATAQSLLLIVAVLLVGLACCVAMRARPTGLSRLDGPRDGDVTGEISAGEQARTA